MSSRSGTHAYVVPDIIPKLIVERFVGLTDGQDQQFLEVVSEEIFYHYLARYSVNIRVAMSKPKGSQIVRKDREKAVKKQWMSKASKHGVSNWPIRHFFLPVCVVQLESSSRYQFLMHANEEIYERTEESFKIWEVLIRADHEDLQLERSEANLVGGRKLVADTIFNGKRIEKNLEDLRKAIDYIDSLLFWPIFAWFVELQKIATNQTNVAEDWSTSFAGNWVELAEKANVPKEAIHAYFVPICEELSAISRNYITKVQGSIALQKAANKFLKNWESVIRREIRNEERRSKKVFVPSRRKPRTTFVRGSR